MRSACTLGSGQRELPGSGGIWQRVQRWVAGLAFHPAPLHLSHTHPSVEGRGSPAACTAAPGTQLCAVHPGAPLPEDSFCKGSKHAWCGLHLPTLLHRGENLEKSAWKLSLLLLLFNTQEEKAWEILLAEGSASVLGALTACLEGLVLLDRAQTAGLEACAQGGIHALPWPALAAPLFLPWVPQKTAG